MRAIVYDLFLTQRLGLLVTDVLSVHLAIVVTKAWPFLFICCYVCFFFIVCVNDHVLLVSLL